MSDFEERFRRLAATHPHQSLTWALWALEHKTADGDDLAPGPGAPVEALAEYAFENSEIRFFMPDKKIHAIKKLRELANVGLKEAKDAIELAEQWRQAGRSPREEREQLEREAEQAIESIMRSAQQ